MTSPIQAVAVAALEQQRAALLVQEQERTQQLVDAARTHLASLGVDSGLLTVEHVDVPAELVVLSDGTVSLGVYADGRLALVEDPDGDGHWTPIAGPRTSLAALADAAGWAS